MDTRKNRSSRGRLEPSKPYDRVKTSFFGQVRQFFTPASWASSPPPAKRFSYPVPHTPGQSTPPKRSSSVVNSPNTTLAEFFQHRGEAPLNAIEYEGVQSLLRQLSEGRSPTPDLVRSASTPTDPHNSLPSGTHETPLAGMAPSLKRTSTPQGMRTTLRASPSTSMLATPSFNPTYASPGGSPVPMASARRVYQFSGLPSPYRTRIRSPLVARLPRITLPAAPEKRALSNTASALLSLLEAPPVEEPVSYSNPYSKRKSARLEPAAVKKASIKDIEETAEAASAPVLLEPTALLDATTPAKHQKGFGLETSLPSTTLAFSFNAPPPSPLPTTGAASLPVAVAVTPTVMHFTFPDVMIPATEPVVDAQLVSQYAKIFTF